MSIEPPKKCFNDTPYPPPPIRDVFRIFLRDTGMADLRIIEIKSIYAPPFSNGVGGATCFAPTLETVCLYCSKLRKTPKSINLRNLEEGGCTQFTKKYIFAYSFQLNKIYFEPTQKMYINVKVKNQLPKI